MWRGLSVYISKSYLHTSKSHKLSLEHHGLLIGVDLEDQDMKITHKFPQNLGITSTSLNTSFPHLTLILKAGMLSATEGGLLVRYKSQILGSQQKQISLRGTEPYPLSRYEFPPRCQVIPVLKAATCLL